jgi:hypothetical protein
MWPGKGVDVFDTGANQLEPESVYYTKTQKFQSLYAAAAAAADEFHIVGQEHQTGEWASNITRIGRGREKRMRMEGNKCIKKRGRGGDAGMDGWRRRRSRVHFFNYSLFSPVRRNCGMTLGGQEDVPNYSDRCR